jgi:hypothetical protein
MLLIIREANMSNSMTRTIWSRSAHVWCAIAHGTIAADPLLLSTCDVTQPSPAADIARETRLPSLVKEGEAHVLQKQCKPSVRGNSSHDAQQGHQPGRNYMLGSR